MTFTEYLQRECGSYDIKTILENLLQFQINEAIDEYKELNGGEMNLTPEEVEAFNYIIDKKLIND